MRRRSTNPFGQTGAGPTGLAFSNEPVIQRGARSSVIGNDPMGSTPLRSIGPSPSDKRTNLLPTHGSGSRREAQGGSGGSAGSRMQQEQFTRRSQIHFSENLGHPSEAEAGRHSPAWRGSKAEPSGSLHERQVPKSQQHLHDPPPGRNRSMLQNQQDSYASGGVHGFSSSSFQHRSPYGASNMAPRGRGMDNDRWGGQQPNEEDGQHGLFRGSQSYPSQDSGGRSSAMHSAMAAANAAAAYSQSPYPSETSQGMMSKGDHGLSMGNDPRLDLAPSGHRGRMNGDARASMRGAGNFSEPIIKQGVKEQSYLNDYAAGLALRYGVLVPLIRTGKYNDPSLLTSMTIELGKYFRGECVLLRQGGADGTSSGGMHENGLSASDRRYIPGFVDNASATDSNALRRWFDDPVEEGGGDSYLPYSSKEWSDAWAKRVMLESEIDRRGHFNREVIKLAAYLDAEDGLRKKSKETIVGVALIERNCATEGAESAGKTGGGSKKDKGTTRIVDVRLAPVCNPHVMERSKWCSRRVLGASDGEHKSLVSPVDVTDVLLTLYRQILHRSLLYGTGGVTVECPKDSLFELFYLAQMGRPQGRSKDGRFVFSITGQDRLRSIRNGFEKYHGMVQLMKENKRFGERQTSFERSAVSTAGTVREPSDAGRGTQEKSKESTANDDYDKGREAAIVVKKEMGEEKEDGCDGTVSAQGGVASVNQEEGERAAGEKRVASDEPSGLIGRMAKRFRTAGENYEPTEGTNHPSPGPQADPKKDLLAIDGATVGGDDGKKFSQHQLLQGLVVKEEEKPDDSQFAEADEDEEQGEGWNRQLDSSHALLRLVSEATNAKKADDPKFTAV